MRYIQLLVIAVTIAVVCCGPWSSGQVVYSALKPADKLLEEYLLSADEMTRAYCVQIVGTLSKTSRDGRPFLFDVQSFSALRSAPTRSSYHAYGLFDAIFPGPAGYQWSEVVVHDGVYFDKGTLGEQKMPPQQYAKEKEGEKLDPLRPRKRAMSRIDPFGLALIDEGGLDYDRSNLATIQTMYLKYSLVESKVTDEGDVIGIWDLDTPGQVMVKFGGKQQYYPIDVRFRGFDREKKSFRDWGGPTKTLWTKYGADGLAPKAISMTGKRFNGDKYEFNFEFAWLDPKVWAKSKIDFEAMTRPEPQNWREPFRDLFNAQGK